MIDYYLLARISGVSAFGLMLVQIILATWFRHLIKWHMRIGKIVFGLVWLHPTLFGFAWNLGGYVWLGRIALVLLTIAVTAAILRIKYWQWVHRLNYVAFVLIYVHSWNLGSDVRRWPLVILWWLAPVVVVLSLTKKLVDFKIASNGNR